MDQKNNRKIRILSVEDDDGTRRVLTMIYGQVYRFDAAETLAEAAEKLKTRTYDVVVLDIELPDGKGTTLLQSIRQDPAFAACRDVPVVMLSASSDGALCEQTWDLGSVAFVKKPFEVPDLSAAIDCAVASGRAAQAPGAPA